MKKLLIVTLFMLASLAWASAQQAGSAGSMGRQPTVPSQTPDATQSQPGVPGSADSSGMPGQAAAPPITEGCLGGSAPNFTITDKTGTTYKLNIPPSADSSALTPHVGESVQVQGTVSSGKTSSIDVQRIGRGTGTCAGGGAAGAQPSPKQ